MAVLPFIDLAQILDDAGFPRGEPQETALAVVAAESGRNPKARHQNADGSVDRGMWQINSHHHIEVTDQQADDPVTSTRAAFKISRQGTDFTPWAAYKNGSYRQHLEAARVALDGAARVRALTAKKQLP